MKIIAIYGGSRKQLKSFIKMILTTTQRLRVSVLSKKFVRFIKLKFCSFDFDTVPGKSF